MNSHGGYADSHEYRRTQHRSDHPLQLPSFQNLIRDVGQADLVYRGQAPHPSELPSPPIQQQTLGHAFQHTSLPTPPATSQGKQSSDRFYINNSTSHRNGHQGYEQDLSNGHRRASMALPMTDRPPAPRPARAYSSNNMHIEPSRHEVLGWQHGRFAIEEEPAVVESSLVLEDVVNHQRELPIERVNPKWGTTKAGKPRKRLGQACNTCREKKTKCDPGYPKCSQCQRFNRDCRFDQNSRQTRRSPELRGSTRSPHTTSNGTGTHFPSDSFQRRTSFVTPMEAASPTDLDASVSSASPASISTTKSPAMAERQVDNTRTPSKRPRLDGHENGHAAGRSISSTESSSVLRRESGEDFPELRSHTPQPRTMVQKYLETWFDTVNMPTTDVMPRETFLRWALSPSNKSLQDRVAVYAMLASATFFSRATDKVQREDRSFFKKVVYEHLDELENDPCLQLVHTLLYLAITELYDASRARWHALFGRCVNTAGFLRMYTEPVPQNVNAEAYGFSSEVFAECRRRTFWTIYCIDCQIRTTKLAGPVLGGFGNIFLRLPCSSRSYDQGRIPTLPFFDLQCLTSTSANSAEQAVDSRDLSPMAYLSQILSICLLIVQDYQRRELTLTYMGRNQPATIARQDLERMLQGWAEGYTASLRARYGKTAVVETPSPRDTQIQGARACKFAGFDVFYHFAHLEMNRRVFDPALSQNERKNRGLQARTHAGLLLKLARQLLEKGGAETEEYELVTRTPAVGAVLLSSIDIITAAGSTQALVDSSSGLMSSLYIGLELLEKLGQMWELARTQRQMVEARIRAVFSAAQAAVTQGKGYFYCANPIVPLDNQSVDLAYGGDRLLYLKLVHNAPADLHESQVFVV